MRSLRHRDFLLLWFGAFLSFIGSWIQNVAQGWLVFNLTHDESALAVVSFLSNIPVAIIGPFAGTLTDTLNKRSLLNFLQFLLALSSFAVAICIYYKIVSFSLLSINAFVVGIVSCAEMPTRQSLVSRVVPKEELQQAIPVNNMTFNVARLIGPAIGGYLLEHYGAEPCYVLNGISFFALIIGVQMIRSDLGPGTRSPQPIKDLILEGFLYTFRNKQFKTLFFLEAITSGFGLAYLVQMPAIAADILHVGKVGLGHCYVAVGVGALPSLGILVWVDQRKIKGKLICASMIVMGLGLLGLSTTRNIWVAMPLFACLGGASIMHFNITNSLFQTLAPDNLRGRILSMHVWAISGLGPFGILALGFIAKWYSIQLVLVIGAVALLTGGIYAMQAREWRKGI